MSAKLPPTVIDQEGREWWTIAEAARRWGVRPRRVYKWIRGIAGSSKGVYTRKDGTRLQRKVTHDRIRLTEGQDYVYSQIGKRTVTLIRPQAYPAPITTPMVRPDFIGQGEHPSTITYGYNVQDGYGTPSVPFTNPFASEFDFTLPTTEPTAEPTSEIEARAKGKKKAEKEQPALKLVPPTEEVLEPEPEPTPSRALTERQALTIAQQMVGRFRARFAEKNRTDPAAVTVAELRYAARRKAEVDQTTAEDVLFDVFGQLFESIYRDPNEPWTRDNAQVTQVRDAFIEIFRQSGPLDGFALLD